MHSKLESSAMFECTWFCLKPIKTLKMILTFCKSIRKDQNILKTSQAAYKL